MKKLVWSVLLSVMASLLGAGILFLVARPPAGEAIQLLPAPTIPPRVVYVSGAVDAPGVYNLPPGSRVVDAIEAAGGLTQQANSEILNYAQVVTDGMRIDVPELLSPSQDESWDGSDGTSRSTELTSDLVNINTANQGELESLPEIGPYLASEIIAYREMNGPFKSLEELLNVKGIGTVILETIRDLITVGEYP